MTLPFKMSLSTWSSRYYKTCSAQCLDVITTISKLTCKITITISQMLGPLLHMVVKINHHKVAESTTSKKSFHSKSQSNILITDKTHLISNTAPQNFYSERNRIYSKALISEPWVAAAVTALTKLLTTRGLHVWNDICILLEQPCGHCTVYEHAREDNKNC
jgi:hypothetical protein